MLLPVKMNKANLSIFLLFGLPLIAQYIWLATGTTGLSKDEMWGYSPELFRKISIGTIILSFIAGLYLFYYLTWRYCETDKYTWLAMVGLTILIGASNFWVPSMRSKSKIGSILTLSIAAIGSLFVLSSVIMDCSPMDAQKIVGIVSATVLVFQTTIMDAIVWNIYNK